MAKQKGAQTSERLEDNRDRVTIRASSEWLSALNLMATAKRSTQSDYVISLVQKELASMPRSESDLIRGMVKLETGKALRLDNGVKGSADNLQHIGPGGAGQGSGLSEQACDAAEDHSATNPPDRIHAINRIKRRSIEDPTDATIPILYQTAEESTN